VPVLRQAVDQKAAYIAVPMCLRIVSNTCWDQTQVGLDLAAVVGQLVVHMHWDHIRVVFGQLVAAAAAAAEGRHWHHNLVGVDLIVVVEYMGLRHM
jgi:hypothetical protein